MVALLCNPATLEAGVRGWYEIGSPVTPCLMSIGCPLEVRCQYGCLSGSTGDQVDSKERWTGPGSKDSSSKPPHWTVKGLHPWMSTVCQPIQQDQTWLFLLTSIDKAVYAVYTGYQLLNLHTTLESSEAPLLAMLISIFYWNRKSLRYAKLAIEVQITKA